MKICYLTPFFPPHQRGGAEITLKLLSEAMAKRGHKVHVFTPNYQGPDKNSKSSLTVHYITWGTYGVFSLNNLIAYRKVLRAVIKSGVSFDVIDGFNWPALTEYIAKKLGKPYIVSIRDITPLSDLRISETPKKYSLVGYFRERFKYFGVSPKQFLFGLQGYFLTARNQKALKKAAALSVASEALYKVFKDYNKNCFISGSAITIPKPKKLDFSKRKKVVVYIGRLSRGKGFDFLLKAALDLVEGKNNKLRFVFIGEGEVPSLQRKFKSRILFKGRISHSSVDKTLEESLLTVVPSIVFEGLPRVALESLSFGTPVIATDVGGNKEAVDGGGLIVKPGDSVGLKISIFNTARDSEKWTFLSRRGLKHVHNYSSQLMAKKVEWIYKGVLR